MYVHPILETGVLFRIQLCWGEELFSLQFIVTHPFLRKYSCFWYPLAEPAVHLQGWNEIVPG